MKFKWPVDFHAEDERALYAEFGVGGVCGCDGSLDDGCPLCDPEQFCLWWIRRDAGKKSRFDRKDVV